MYVGIKSCYIVILSVCWCINWPWYYIRTCENKQHIVIIGLCRNLNLIIDRWKTCVGLHID